MPETDQPPPSKSKFEEFVLQSATAMFREPPHLQHQLDQLRDLYQPANVQEEFWLKQIAHCQLRVERIGRIESGLFSQAVDEAWDLGYKNLNAYPEKMRDDSDLAIEQRLNFILAAGFIRMAEKKQLLPMFSRFQTQAERQLRHAQEQFDRLRKQHLTPPSSPERKTCPDTPAGRAATARERDVPAAGRAATVKEPDIPAASRAATARERDVPDLAAKLPLPPLHRQKRR